MRTQRILVIGAGIGGLVAALMLARRGFEADRPMPSSVEAA